MSHPEPDRPRVLVVGLGVAGTATAKRLSEVGWQVDVIERAPGRRTGGYFIMLFGSGAAAAQRLGILDDMPSRAASDGTTWQVSRSGRRSAGMGFGDIPGGPRMLIRGDVEDALHKHLPEAVRVRFSTTPVVITQAQDQVEVTVREEVSGDLTAERYDLVIGADGVRSSVRRLVFGPDADFVEPTGYLVGATLLSSHLTGFTAGQGAVLAEPGRSATAFAFRNRPPSLLFSYRAEDPAAELARPAIESIREAFGPEPSGPVLGEMLDRFERAEDYLFDEAVQVRMPNWCRGRVALIGDAAWCMTLYSGLGASSGIAGADLLGSLLQRHEEDVPAALKQWQQRLLPFVTYQHEHIDANRQIFVPATRAEQLQGKLARRLMALRPLRQLLMSGPGAKDFRMKNLDVAAL